jgi:hypothetical protein
MKRGAVFRPEAWSMNNTTRGLAIAAVTTVFVVIATLLGKLFGDPLLWSAAGGVIGVLFGLQIFRKR